MNGNDRVTVGYYSYIGPDGQTYTVNYIADRNGYRATGSHLPVQPGIPVPGVSGPGVSSSLPPFPAYASGSLIPSPVIPLQSLQPGYVTSTPSPLIVSSSPYTPTPSPFSPTQSIYTPSSTFIPSSTPYPYIPSSSAYPYSPTSSAYPYTSTPYTPYASTTPAPYVSSSTFLPNTTPIPPSAVAYTPSLFTNNPPFPIYTQSSVPFPGYTYTPQGPVYNSPSYSTSSYNSPSYSSYPSGSGYSTPVTRFNFGTTPASLTRATSSFTTPSPNLVLPSSTPSPLVRPYQPTYGLANNNNAPAIIASTPRPFTVAPLYNSNEPDTIYITPSPKVYINQGVQALSNQLPGNLLINREIQPPYIGGNVIDSNYYRNNYGFQNVRPLRSLQLTKSGGHSLSADATITNMSFRQSKQQSE